MMGKEFIKKLDYEYEQFLRIMQPYLLQLQGQRLASICTSWLERLSTCKEHEKNLRNKYVITLFYQLSKGIINEPFIKEPTSNELLPISGPELNEISIPEVGCLAVTRQIDGTGVDHDEKPSTLNSIDSIHEAIELDNLEVGMLEETCSSDMIEIKESSVNNQTFYSLQSPKNNKDYKNTEYVSETYGYRTNQIISKLREIKKQNASMQNELQELRKKSSIGNDGVIENDINDVKNPIFKTEICNNTCIVNSLKSTLKEVKSDKNGLINKTQSVQEYIDNLNDYKNKQIDDVFCDKHKLELTSVKSSFKGEIKRLYEEKFNDQKQMYEAKISVLEIKNKNALHEITSIKDIIIEKDQVIQQKELELMRLLEELKDKENVVTILKQRIDTCNRERDNYFKVENKIMEKLIKKMEKSKMKYVRAYESKIASLQRQKHMLECSFKMQLAVQRAKIFTDVIGESRAEITDAIEKLEAKYKGIVASVQATAIQRRLEDQMAVTSILQAASGENCRLEELDDLFEKCVPQRDTNHKAQN